MKKKAIKFWGCYLVVACIIVYAANKYTESIEEEHSKAESALMQDWYEVRAVAEKQAENDGYIIRAVMKAAMAAATNNIADMEPGSLMDCIDATCRVKTVTAGSMYSVGTGVVFKIDNDTVYVLTNAHVATTDSMKLEFWKDGHKLDAVVGKTTLRDRQRDVAVISVPRSKFVDYLPTVIPLAARGTVLEDGQTIMSAGCPKATWTRAWIGHVENTKNGRVAFQPGPYGGQSGSALFNATGSEIVALLNLQERNSRDGPIIRGYAVTLENIYIAVYGEVVEKDTNYWKRQRSWPYAKVPAPAQCGPKGCPRPEKYGGDEGVPVPDLPLVLPEIVPEIVLPEIVVIPELSELPEVEALPDGTLGVEPPIQDRATSRQCPLVDLAMACVYGAATGLLVLLVCWWIFLKGRE